MNKVGSMNFPIEMGKYPMAEAKAKIEGRDSRGRFVKGNVPRNKRQDSPRVITFTCKFCGKTKSLDDMRVVTRFFPPLPACKDCWKIHQA